MNRDEVQAVIDEMMSEADISQRSAMAAARGGDQALSREHVGEELGLRRSAQMLADALANSKICPGCDHPKHGIVCMVGWEPYPTELAPEGAREREPGSGCNCHKVTS